MIIFFYIVSLLIEKKSLKQLFVKKNIKLFITIFITLFVIPMSLFSYWNNYVKSVDIPAQFKISDIKVSEMYNIYSGKTGNSDQNQTAKNYITAITYQLLSLKIYGRWSSRSRI